MIYTIQLIIDDIMRLDLAKVDIPRNEMQNLSDALNCELLYNDLDMEL